MSWRLNAGTDKILLLISNAFILNVLIFKSNKFLAHSKFRVKILSLFTHPRFKAECLWNIKEDVFEKCVHIVEVNRLQCCLVPNVLQNIFFSAEERMLYKFGMTCRCVNNDRVWIFGWIISLNLKIGWMQIFWLLWICDLFWEESYFSYNTH